MFVYKSRLSLAPRDSVYRLYSTTERGQAAVAKLAAEGHPGAVVFHELEVTSPPSAVKLSAWLAAKYGGLDVLVGACSCRFPCCGLPWPHEKVKFDYHVNNAGVLHQVCDYGTARTTIDINYYGTKTVTVGLRPRIRAGGRVINVASGLGELSNYQNNGLHAQAAALNDFGKVDSFAEQFVEDVREGRWREAGWPTAYHSYTVAKTAQLAYTRLLAAEEEAQPGGSKVFINAICPGYCATDMTEYKGRHTWLGFHGTEPRSKGLTRLCGWLCCRRQSVPREGSSGIASHFPSEDLLMPKKTNDHQLQVLPVQLYSNHRTAIAAQQSAGMEQRKLRASPLAAFPYLLPAATAEDAPKATSRGGCTSPSASVAGTSTSTSTSASASASASASGTVACTTATAAEESRQASHTVGCCGAGCSSGTSSGTGRRSIASASTSSSKEAAQNACDASVCGGSGAGCCRCTRCSCRASGSSPASKRLNQHRQELVRVHCGPSGAAGSGSAGGARSCARASVSSSPQELRESLDDGLCVEPYHDYLLGVVVVVPVVPAPPLAPPPTKAVKTCTSVLTPVPLGGGGGTTAGGVTGSLTNTAAGGSADGAASGEPVRDTVPAMPPPGVVATVAATGGDGGGEAAPPMLSALTKNCKAEVTFGSVKLPGRPMSPLAFAVRGPAMAKGAPPAPAAVMLTK
eukprot:SM000002S05514  [mRNA]  locus=s2:312771:317258:+ [translate_table: standard]